MVDISASPTRSHEQIAVDLLAAGVRTLQLRAKSADEVSLAAMVENLLPLVEAAGARLILNDNLDVAASFAGVGLHLGQNDADPRSARDILGSDVWIGWSTHTMEQVEQAQALPIDYIGFGPIFSAAGKHRNPSDSRVPHRGVGVERLGEVVRKSSLPVVAIGGINEDNLTRVLSTGVATVAVIAAVTTQDDMLAAAKRIHHRVERGWKE